MTTHLVTGGTGFLGSALILELLRTDPECTVVGIARGNSTQNAADRLQEVLLNACVLYEDLALQEHVLRRTRAVNGDITEPLCGVDLAQFAADEDYVVWHCAASLRFRDQDEELLTAHNVAGVEHIVALAEQLHAQSFNQISTAYVAGGRCGAIAEQDLGNVADAHNAYERSKIAAEARGWQLCQAAKLPMRVLRPSIVVGHSTTFQAFNHTGMYGVVRALLWGRLQAEQLGVALSAEDLQMVGDPETQLNFIPIDMAARNCVVAGLQGASGQTYHITNESQVTLRRIMDLATAEVGLPEMTFVASVDQLGGVGQILNSKLDFYRSYISGTKDFSTTNVAHVAGAEATRHDLTDVALKAMLAIFVDQERPVLAAKVRA